MFTMLDCAKWKRYAHFRHFYDDVPCAVSLTDDIDVTDIRRAASSVGRSFYITVLYAVSRVVNSHEEFRLRAVDKPEFEYPMPAVWDRVDPVHNIFHADSETYSTAYTVYDPDYDKFYFLCSEDIARVKSLDGLGVPSPSNTFEASCIPWRHFTSVGASSEFYSLTPTVVWGGFRYEGNKTFMPLSITVSHASCDGFHLARFLCETESELKNLAGQI